MSTAECDPAFQAFEAFAAALGVLLVLTRHSAPCYMHTSKLGIPILYVPDAFTPQQQGELGATLASIVFQGRTEAA